MYVARRSASYRPALDLLTPYWFRFLTSAYHSERVIRGFKSYTRYRGKHEVHDRLLTVTQVDFQ